MLFIKKNFFLTWYKNLIYANKKILNNFILKKSFFNIFCNSFSYNKFEFKFIYKKPFIHFIIIKYIKLNKNKYFAILLFLKNKKKASNLSII